MYTFWSVCLSAISVHLSILQFISLNTLKYKREMLIQIRRRGMITNEANLNQRPNDKDVNDYRTSDGLQQWLRPIPHSQLWKDPTWQMQNNSNGKLTAWVKYKTMNEIQIWYTITNDTIELQALLTACERTFSCFGL